MHRRRDIRISVLVGDLELRELVAQSAQAPELRDDASECDVCLVDAAAAERFRHDLPAGVPLVLVCRPHEVAEGRAAGFADVIAVPTSDLHARLAMVLELHELRARQADYEQLRALAARVQTAREDERARVAREVHDVLGQALTGLKIDINWVGGRLSDEALAQRVADMSRIIDSTIQVVRRISRELRPGILDDLGLVAAVQWQAREFEARSGVRVDIVECSDDFDCDTNTATGAFRIYQEILTNVARHAEATQVTVRLVRSRAGLLLEVSDNGKGMTPADRTGRGSLGVLLMRERAALIGGQLEFESAPGEGTRVRLRVPLPQDEVRA